MICVLTSEEDNINKRRNTIILRPMIKMYYTYIIIMTDITKKCFRIHTFVGRLRVRSIRLKRKGRSAKV